MASSIHDVVSHLEHLSPPLVRGSRQRRPGPQLARHWLGKICVDSAVSSPKEAQHPLEATSEVTGLVAQRHGITFY